MSELPNGLLILLGVGCAACVWMLWRSFHGGIIRMRRDDSGAAALEFAIVGPIMILLMLGTIYVGLGFYLLNALQFATTQACVASVAGQGASPQTVFTANVPAALQNPSLALNPGTGSTQCSGTGSFLVPFASLLDLGSDMMVLNASATAATPAAAPAAK